MKTDFKYVIDSYIRILPHLSDDKKEYITKKIISALEQYENDRCLDNNGTLTSIDPITIGLAHKLRTLIIKYDGETPKLRSNEIIRLCNIDNMSAKEMGIFINKNMVYLKSQNIKVSILKQGTSGNKYVLSMKLKEQTE